MRVSSHSDAFHNNITTSDAAQNTSVNIVLLLINCIFVLLFTEINIFQEFSVDNLDFSNMSEKDTINNSAENDLTEVNYNFFLK